MRGPFSLFLFASSTFAFSLLGKSYGTDCLTQKAASDLVNGFVTNVDNNYNYAAANVLLAEKFSFTSQGLNSLLGLTGAALQGPTFTDKQAYLQAEGNRGFPLSVKVSARAG